MVTMGTPSTAARAAAASGRFELDISSSSSGAVGARRTAEPTVVGIALGRGQHGADLLAARVHDGLKIGETGLPVLLQPVLPRLQQLIDRVILGPTQAQRLEQVLFGVVVERLVVIWSVGRLVLVLVAGPVDLVRHLL